MSIVHGKSEYLICKSIKSNLKIKHEIIANDKGTHPIQITSLMRCLNGQNLKSFRNFIRSYSDVEYEKGKLINFSLFIIMDVDDCSPIEKDRFLSKEMFREHWLNDYIIPIFNEPNLESTMKTANIKVESKKDYIVVFPTNHGDLDMDIAKEFEGKLRRCGCSNLSRYVQYCIEIAEQRDVNF